MPPAEQRLWERIRDRQLAGAHFRRQHAVGTYIVDFFCAKSKLVIEVDGDTHADQVTYDAERTKWLNEQRQYRVVRFTNRDIYGGLDDVLVTISEMLGPPPGIT
jgi:very-short-patch-repair endonuclease